MFFRYVVNFWGQYSIAYLKKHIALGLYLCP